MNHNGNSPRAQGLLLSVFNEKTNAHHVRTGFYQYLPTQTEASPLGKDKREMGEGNHSVHQLMFK